MAAIALQLLVAMHHDYSASASILWLCIVQSTAAVVGYICWLTIGEKM